MKAITNITGAASISFEGWGGAPAHIARQATPCPREGARDDLCR